MRYFPMVLLVAICLLISSTLTFAAPWVEREDRGASLRCPQGWKVDWGDRGVGVEHPQDRMIWCKVAFVPFQGSSQQMAEAVFHEAAGQQVSDLRIIKQMQISRRPDLYGIKFSGFFKGISVTSLVLTVTEDGRNFVIRQFSSPTSRYDEMKWTLIAIILSLPLLLWYPITRASHAQLRAKLASNLPQVPS